MKPIRRGRWIALILTAVVSTGSSIHARADLEPPLIRTIDVNGTSLIANSFGQTLYILDPDQAAGKPTCVGTCAEKWPPYILTPEEAGTLPAPLSVMTRDNGLLQVTHKGRPLYLFYLDRTVGELKGNGLGRVWHVVSP